MLTKSASIAIAVILIIIVLVVIIAYCYYPSSGCDSDPRVPKCSKGRSERSKCEDASPKTDSSNWEEWRNVRQQKRCEDKTA